MSDSTVGVWEQAGISMGVGQKVCISDSALLC